VENNTKFLAWHWWEAKGIGPSPSHGFAVLFGSKGLGPVCFCVSKVLLTKFKNFLFFY